MSWPQDSASISFCDPVYLIMIIFIMMRVFGGKGRGVVLWTVVLSVKRLILQAIAYWLIVFLRSLSWALKFMEFSILIARMKMILVSASPSRLGIFGLLRARSWG